MPRATRGERSFECIRLSGSSAASDFGCLTTTVPQLRLAALDVSETRRVLYPLQLACSTFAAVASRRTRTDASRCLREVEFVDVSIDRGRRPSSPFVVVSASSKGFRATNALQNRHIKRSHRDHHRREQQQPRSTTFQLQYFLDTHLISSSLRAASRARSSACSFSTSPYRFLAARPLATACSDRAARAFRHHLRARKPRAPDWSATVAARSRALRRATTRSRQKA